MAKILLINPIIREEDKPKHIPYGLSLLAQIAIDKGHDVQLYDANAWRLGYEVVEQVATADDWDIIGIGGLTTAYSSIKKILSICKKASPNSFIVAGGGFITSMPLDIMEWIKEIDLGVIGEAFLTWPEILEKVDKKDFNFTETLGVCYRNHEGIPVLTDVRPNISDLDIIPYPAWDLLPMDIYFENSQLLYSESAYLAKRRIDINGSLGCSLVCKYCWHLGIIGDMTVEKNSKGVKDVRFSYGRNIRYHSPRYIIDMVKTLVKKYNIDFVSFIDENMMTMDAASGRTWLFELCDLWIKEGLQPTSRRDGIPDSENKGGVFWGGTSHATLHTEEVLRAMYKAGCSHLVYGIESFDPTILKNLGKGSNQKNNLDAIPKCMETGIIPLPNIIIGFPEETFDSVRTTIECMKKIGMYSRPHFATPYPGSEWYYTYKDSILDQYNGNLEAYIEDLGDASKITAVISHNFSPIELLGLQEIVAKRDLRLLEQTIAHYKESGRINNALENPYVLPNSTFNIIKKKVTTPLEQVTSI